VQQDAGYPRGEPIYGCAEDGHQGSCLRRRRIGHSGAERGHPAPRFRSRRVPPGPGAGAAAYAHPSDAAAIGGAGGGQLPRPGERRLERDPGGVPGVVYQGWSTRRPSWRARGSRWTSTWQGSASASPAACVPRRMPRPPAEERGASARENSSATEVGSTAVPLRCATGAQISSGACPPCTGVRFWTGALVLEGQWVEHDFRPFGLGAGTLHFDTRPVEKICPIRRAFFLDGGARNRTAEVRSCNGRAFFSTVGQIYSDGCGSDLHRRGFFLGLRRTELDQWRNRLDPWRAGLGGWCSQVNRRGLEPDGTGSEPGRPLSPWC